MARQGNRPKPSPVLKLGSFLLVGKPGNQKQTGKTIVVTPRRFGLGCAPVLHLKTLTTGDNTPL